METPRDPRRIVVVGPCASGKTTLARGLRRLGYQATVCGQEHSEIPTLWQHTNPDVVIALQIDLPTLRRRRGADWPETLYLTQQRRLSSAFSAAAIVLDTAALDADAALTKAVRALSPGE